MAAISLALPLESVASHGLATTASTPTSTISALWHFLDAELSVPPPSKRQRLTIDDEHEEDTVCIAEIKIQLVEDSADDWMPRTMPPVPVKATFLRPPDYEHGWSVVLRETKPQQKGPHVDIRFMADLGPDVDAHFNRLATFSGIKTIGDPPVVIEHSLHGSENKGCQDIYLSSKILWKPSAGPGRTMYAHCRNMLEAYMPIEADADAHEELSPQMFYNAVHTPESSLEVPDNVQHPALQAELFPFQRRTVNWLLNREGVRFASDGSVEQIPHIEQDPPFSYASTRDMHGTPALVSPLLARVVRDAGQARGLNDCLRGGILSEEMGLGKTVEMISLLALNARREGLGQIFHDAYSDSDVTASAATLIITPPSILEQWRSEIASHAPSLKVFVYEHSLMSEPGIRKTLMNQHVVLTTYRTLSSEIWHAEEKRDRSLRHRKKYEASKSPLMEILWWRVCLDEAQMVESGVSNAATVARRIPRCNAWAITGTPVRKNVQDLCGLLVFLRFEPFCTPDNWKRLRASHSSLFKQIFAHIALRHTKAQIRSELRLPPQRRITVTIPFTAIEEQHYIGMFAQMCGDVGVDSDGGPLSGSWDPENSSTVEKMRSWLVRLRQTCLHPEVGSSNRRALGKRTGPLRTVEEVLDVMMEQNETALRSEERAALNAKLTQGHLYAISKQGEAALTLYLDALSAAQVSVKDCRRQLAEQEQNRANEKVRGDAMKTEDVGEISDEEPEDDKKDGSSAYRSRLRNALELEHACLFFSATAYYQIKESQAEGSSRFLELEAKETEYYERAKQIRAEILAESADKAKALMLRVKAKLEQQIKPLEIQHEPPRGGIESRAILNQYGLLKDLINDQSEVLATFRGTLTKLLTVTLLDQEDNVELTGDEYETTLSDQDESYAYLFLLRGMLSDRHEMITGQANYLLQHEIKEAARLANDNQGHAPRVMKEGLRLRLMCRTDPDKPSSLRGIVAEIRAFLPGAAELRDSRSPEVLIMEQELETISRVLNEQAKDCNKLTKELDMLRATMNARLEYYRQLQTVSDQVKLFAEETAEELDNVKLQEQVDKEQRHADSLAGLRTKARFLQHLRDTKDATAEDRRPCVICQTPFETGVLTVCAHEFCKECLQMWMAQHRNCPVCKHSLRVKDLHEITYKPKNLEAAEEEAATHSPTAERSDNPIYSAVSRRVLDDVNSIDLPQSWGSKIDTICRHLIYLRASDPGAKSIIFSQYRDFLQVLSRALDVCKIGFADIAHKAGIQRFKNDPAAETFLLHAQADSSGLNLVNATHVLLCEPLANTAIELQAVARVHRIGQRQSTTVWMFLVRDTVEESIYDMSVARRLAHLRASHDRLQAQSRAKTPAPGDETDRGLDVANSAELQSAPLSNLLDKAKTGGELVRQDDLWRCLFARTSRRADDRKDLQELQQTLGRELRAEAAARRNV